MSVVERERAPKVTQLEPNPVRDVLRGAKARIVTGWMQLGDGRKKVGARPRHCVVSAVMRAADAALPDDFCAASRLGGSVANLLRAELGDAAPSLSRWNDTPERTHAEVVALFDKALLSA